MEQGLSIPALTDELTHGDGGVVDPPGPSFDVDDPPHVCLPTVSGVGVVGQWTLFSERRLRLRFVVVGVDQSLSNCLKRRKRFRLVVAS